MTKDEFVKRAQNYGYSDEDIEDVWRDVQDEQKWWGKNSQTRKYSLSF